MVNYSSKILDLVAGNAYSIERIVDNLGVGQTLSKAYLTIKEEFWDTDADAVIQLNITPTSSASGQITDIGTGDQEGVIKFNLLTSDTIKLSPYFKYIFDIKLITNVDSPHVHELGELIPLPQVTEATS